MSWLGYNHILVLKENINIKRFRMQGRRRKQMEFLYIGTQNFKNAIIIGRNQQTNSRLDTSNSVILEGIARVYSIYKLK